MRDKPLFCTFFFPIVLCLISVFLTIDPNNLSENFLAWQNLLSGLVGPYGGPGTLSLIAILILFINCFIFLRMWKLPKPLEWIEMSKTIRHEIDELKQKIEAGIPTSQFDREYTNVKRNILALATRVTFNRLHNLSSNWMSYNKHKELLSISAHQGFYSYMGRRRIFKIELNPKGSCALSFLEKRVYVIQDTLKNQTIQFLDTIPDERDSLRALINIPIPVMPEKQKASLETIENLVKGDSPLPFDIEAVLNIDSPFKGVFKKSVVQKRVAELIEIGSMLLAIKHLYLGVEPQ